MFLPIYNFGLGKLGLWGAQKLHLLSKAVYPIENAADSRNISGKISQFIGSVGYEPIEKLQRFNEHRRKIANIYFEQLKDIDLILPPKQGRYLFAVYSVKPKRESYIYWLNWRENGYWGLVLYI